jgi:hypothetical protein
MDVLLEARARPDDGRRCLVPISFDTVVVVRLDTTPSAAAVYVQSVTTPELRQFVFANRYPPSIPIRYAGGYAVADTTIQGCPRLLADVDYLPITAYSITDSAAITLLRRRRAFVRGVVVQGDSPMCPTIPSLRVLTVEVSLP